MTFHLAIERKSNYLHAVATGNNTVGNVMGYMEGIIRACQEHDCWRILIEERLEGPRLRTFDVFGIASHGGEAGPGLLRAVAYVDVNAQGDLMRFAEDVLVNRGMPMRLFATVQEAEEWLAHPSPGD